MGLVGFMNVMNIEGAKYNIKTNPISPVAASRSTEGVRPPDLFAKLKVYYICLASLFLFSSKQIPEDRFVIPPEGIIDGFFKT